MVKHPLLAYFKYSHLPAHLQVISKPFGDLADQVAERSHADNYAEITMALRKLLEAKDCAVRAML